MRNKTRPLISSYMSTDSETNTDTAELSPRNHSDQAFIMTVTTLPYMKTNPKLIFFTDFDGTITLEDSRYRRSSHSKPTS